MIKKIVTGFFLAIILGFIAATVYVFFIRSLAVTDSEHVNILMGSFAGAFFAFLFIRISEVTNKIFDRKAKARTSTVKMQHILNDYLHALGGNIFLIEKLLEKKSQIKRKEPIIWTNELHPIPLDKEPLMALTNLQLLNELLTVHNHIKNINETADTINRTNDLVLKAYTERQISLDTYIENLDKMVEDTQELKKFCERAVSEVIRMMAIVSLFLRDDTLIGKLISLLYSKHEYPEHVSNSIDNEIEKIREGIRENSEKSQERINEVLSREVKS